MERIATIEARVDWAVVRVTAKVPNVKSQQLVTKGQEVTTFVLPLAHLHSTVRERVRLKMYKISLKLFTQTISTTDYHQSTQCMLRYTSARLAYTRVH